MMLADWSLAGSETMELFGAVRIGVYALDLHLPM